ncbi:aminoglycoside phosphotransferase family protein [Exiguobacterium sp. B2(2022)]|uniref:aminoglycoside phosphotransferase family protein n=1 Tax=Exiguobacterium sp. B2(2022) TaxID=2992755 RepID=UPI00237A3164|nr:aminoglycoside phosphotransferase family protein [Exiguobacterium sp. B2(2022)]MDE0564250.1 aminoglycoside phosphotransferase family protein [Exiguobacterium sp. B2(2022)]
MDQSNEQEKRLSGGNVSTVYKKGNYVYRTQKEGSERIHQWLRHLEAKQLSGVPRFIGIDDRGREVLTYLEGETADYPLKSYMWSDEAIQDVARLMRRLHDASTDFEWSSDWAPIDNTPQPLEVICHNDFAVYNTIFHVGKVSGIIDFDLAAPGPRAWDIVYALYTFVPLSRRHQAESGEVIYYDAVRDDESYKERVSLFLKAYGWDDPKEDWFKMLQLRIEALCLLMKRKAAEGDIAFQKMIDEGHYDHYQEELRFIQTHGHKWF